MRALSDATAEMLKPIRLAPADRIELDCDNELQNFIAHVIALDQYGEKSIRGPSHAARNTFFDRCPERKYLEVPANHWKLAATDYTAEIIRATWDESRIIWKDQRAKLMYVDLLTTTERQDLNAEVYARFKTKGELPHDIHTLITHPDLPLAPHQKVALYIALRSEGYAHFMEPGCGKTACIIGEVCNLATRHTPKNPLKCLIVPPKSVRTNWLHEFERFATLPGKVNVIRGDSIDRLSAIIQTVVPEPDCYYNVCIMSYESMVRSLDVLTTIEWDLATLDESHFIMRPETQRSKAALQLRNCARRRRVLTGTPVCNTPLDLYAQLEFLGEGYSGFRAWKNFKKFYGVFADVHGDGHEKLVAAQNLPFMKERLSRVSFITTLKEALPDLPDRVYDTYEVEMGTDQQEAYNKLRDELVYQIEGMMGSSANKTMTVQHALVMLLRLAQICNGYVSWDAVFDPETGDLTEPKSIEWFKTDPKLDSLIDILKEKRADQKTLVWSCFVPCIHRISARLEQEGINHVTFYGQTSDAARAEAERRFNYEPDCKVFVGNPAAGGTGLNLLGYPPHSKDIHETNADHSIFYAHDWSYTKRSQAGARNHRKGTRVQVRETDLVVPATIDEEIRVRVMKKKLVAMDIADLREILGAVLSGVAA